MSIGARFPKSDGVAKADGSGIYADDISLPRMLHAKILRSPHAHARIRGIDLGAALAHPGVVATLVGAELPAKYGVIPWTQDETALAVEKVRHVGDAVACVAAVDERTADEALALIEVDYEVLPAVLTPEDALDHPEIKVNEKAKVGNITKHVHLQFGEVDEAVASAAAVARETYRYAGSTHVPIEPHCAVARIDADGNLTVWSSTQIPHYVHRELSRVLGLPQSKVRVIQPLLGGAFGGKSDPFALEFCVAKLAMKTGRPVKILYTREEVFYAHRGRHPMKMDVTLALDGDGRISAVDNKILIDGGAYASFGLVTAYYAGQLLTGPYRFGTYRFDSYRMYTNKPPCGPKRGHGSVQPRFAFEVALDEAAEKLGIDPMEVRRRNFIGEFVETVNGQKITSNGFLKCLELVEKASGWKERHGKLGRGRGLGVAGSMYISGTAYPVYPNEMPQSGVLVKLDRSGRVAIYSGASDIGQGVNTLLCQIAAEELQCDPYDVTVVAADTDLTPVDLGAYSSRVTFMVGLAAREACQKLAAKLRAAGGSTFAEACQKAEAAEGAPLAATGGYRTQKLGGDYRGGTIGASPAYSFTAHVAEVSVDEETGIWKVERIWAAHDCGKALNPTLVEGQIEGSVYMGAAEAQMEEMVYNDKGLLFGPSLLDYRIPTSLDTPDLDSYIVESNDPGGPYGAKEAGEGPLHPAIPAIANAIHDACGIRIRELPFYPQRILNLLRERDRRGEERVAS
ncbi:MAG TPA: molybdopterin cofactor-binding domain-containing protein [Myxococcales bacterium]|nr:molybdopterin cofactor-binding domain-containing protein [Myxococcales bacterium]